MEEHNSWVFFKKIDWDDPKFNRFNVDTRDFHCGYTFNAETHTDIATLEKRKEDFFHTREELEALLERYFNESGGEMEWRFFNLEGMENWSMKYIRIIRTNLGFLVCNNHYRALRKEVLESRIEKEFL